MNKVIRLTKFETEQLKEYETLLKKEIIEVGGDPQFFIQKDRNLITYAIQQAVITLKENKTKKSK